MSDKIVMKVGGHPEGDLVMDATLALCGSVMDGIGVRFSCGNGGGFVIAFGDFERVYLAAKKFRDEHPEQVAKVGEDVAAAMRRQR